MRKPWLNMLAIVLLVVVLVMQYRLWLEKDGIRDMLQLKKQALVQTQENQQLKKRNEELLFQIERLRNSKDAVESRARNELGMIKKGEKFYQVVQ